MSNIGNLITKEFGRLKTDRRTLFLLFFIPLLLIIIFGLTSGGGPTKFFKVSIVTEDSLPQTDFTNQSETYDSQFISVVANDTSTFSLFAAYNVTSEDQIIPTISMAVEGIRNQTISAVLILPANFSECIENNASIPMSFIGDGTNLNVVQAFETGLIEPITEFKLQTHTFANYTVADPELVFDVPTWDSQILNYAVPIILPLVILGTTMNLTSLCIVTETPLPRLVLTPGGKSDFIISKLVAYSIVMFIQTTEIFAMINLFGLYCAGLTS